MNLVQWIRDLKREPRRRYEWFATPIRRGPPQDPDGIVISTRSFCVWCLGERTFEYDPARVPPVPTRASQGWHCTTCDRELVTADRLVAVYH